MWGVNESPLIVGEKIFMTPGGVKNNMVALNKHTGELIWSSPGMGEPSTYCSPQFIDGYAVPMIVTNTNEHIVAINANTGEMLWTHRQTNQNNIHPNTPLYSDGMILSTTGYGGGTVMLRLTNNGRAVEEVWKNSEVDCQMGGIVKVGNHVYATGHKNRNWFCADWNTGEIKYRDRRLAGSNVIYADGMLYLYSDKGEMHLVKPNPDRLEIVSTFNITLGTDQHWAHTVIHNGVLYIRHGNALMAYNIKQ
jgi:outer membrane protein assembly factor BamB